MKLREVKTGQSVIIAGYEGADHTGCGYKSKLLAMGLTKGTVLKLVSVAPLGDPVKVIVRGYSLSLRKGEADALIVEDAK